MDKELHAQGWQTLTPEEALRWAAERIAFHEQLITRLVAQNSALKYGIGMLIGNHPTPGALLKTWNAASPDLVDAEMESPLYQTEAFRESFQGVMSYLTRTMEAATGLPDPDGGESL